MLAPGAAPGILDCDAGLPLGIDPGTEYSITEVQAVAGSVLALTTDGLLESDAGDDFNLSRLLDVLSISQAQDLDELANDLLNSVAGPAATAMMSRCCSRELTTPRRELIPEIFYNLGTSISPDAPARAGPRS